MERDRSISIVGAILVGATAMYFLDPRLGQRRRAHAVDSLHHLLNLTEEGFARVLEGGVTATEAPRLRRLLTPEQIVDDRAIEQRVRATVGRLSSGEVTADTSHGVVTLRGTVPAEELGYLLTGVRRIRGVDRVESHLTTIQGLTRTRGKQRAPKKEPGLSLGLSEELPTPARVMLGATGLTLAVTGIRSGGMLGYAAALLGGLLTARALTNTPSRVLEGPRSTAGAGAVRVQKSIDVQRPTREVFAFWSNFRNFPQFMRHIREVSETESGISHWVADGPAGIPVSWNAEITGLKPHQWIAWRSLDGSTISNEGDVRFEELDENTTRIHVNMSYHPPGGVMGHAVATLFGADPRHQLDDDLKRFKDLLEARNLGAGGSLGSSETGKVTLESLGAQIETSETALDL